jgi:CRISPR/Cas system-associated endonuclease Cas1
MKTAGIGLVLLLSAGAAAAQSPAQDRASREHAIQSGQQRAGMAYSNLQQAQYEAKLAEQDFLNAQEAQRAAQKHAEEMKRQLDGAKRAVDAARQKEAQARKAYDEALSAVDRARQPAPAK